MNNLEIFYIKGPLIVIILYILRYIVISSKKNKFFLLCNPLYDIVNGIAYGIKFKKMFNDEIELTLTAYYAAQQRNAIREE